MERAPTNVSERQPSKQGRRKSVEGEKEKQSAIDGSKGETLLELETGRDGVDNTDEAASIHRKRCKRERESGEEKRIKVAKYIYMHQER